MDGYPLGGRIRMSAAVSLVVLSVATLSSCESVTVDDVSDELDEAASESASSAEKAEDDLRGTSSGGDSTAGPPSGGAQGAPEELSCSKSFYTTKDPDHQFRLLYCDVNSPVQKEKGYVDADKISVARSYLRDYMKTFGVDMKERWQASYVHLCSTEMAERDDYYPAMALTCQWHVDHLSYEDLFAQEEWMSSSLKKRVEKTLEEDSAQIRRIVEEHFPKDEAERQREVYYELREKVWNDYVSDRKKYSSYYGPVDEFRSGVKEGDIEGCAQPLRSKLGEYVDDGDSRARADVVGRFTDSVGYALTEALAQCHWYHGRKLLAGAYLKLLEGHRRRVTFGERLYYAQLAELKKDAKKAEKMPHLEGDELLALKPEDLNAPRLVETQKAQQKWREAQYDLTDSVSLTDSEVERIESSSDRTVVHFPRRSGKVPVKECERTDRIDRITHTGEVVYEQSCEIVDYEQVSHEIPALALEGDYDIEAADWVEFAKGTNEQGRTLYMAGEGDAKDDELIRVLEIAIE